MPANQSRFLLHKFLDRNAAATTMNCDGQPLEIGGDKTLPIAVEHLFNSLRRALPVQ